MIAAMALPGNSSTFLTHMVAHGLKVDRYVAERFQAMADGDIRRWKTPFLPILLHGAVSRPVSGIPLTIPAGAPSVACPVSPYSHPRSRKPARSTPGGAYQPSAPYLAPRRNASSLFPYGIRSGVPDAGAGCGTPDGGTGPFAVGCVLCPRLCLGACSSRNARQTAADFV